LGDKLIAVSPFSQHAQALRNALLHRDCHCKHADPDRNPTEELHRLRPPTLALLLIRQYPPRM
jgi:hypothetical protein